MKNLRKRLSAAGIKRKFLNENVLPGWWEDGIAVEQAGFQEGAVIIANRLGFRLRDLLAEEGELSITPASGVRFKKSKDKSAEDVTLITQIARRVAFAVAKAIEDHKPVRNIPEPKEWRDSLLDESDRDWVCLRHLINASWRLGIPVIHLSAFPTSAKKPDALTTIIDGRPVIVIMNQRKNPSWLAFILAHELGHIFKKHLVDGETIVDPKLSERAEEEQEKEADEFAVTLLTGHRDVALFTPGPMKAAMLSGLARRFGQRYRIAPGVAVLQWAYMTENWSLANQTLKLLEEGDDAPQEFHEAMWRHLPKDTLSEDQRAWLEGLCQH